MKRACSQQVTLCDVAKTPRRPLGIHSTEPVAAGWSIKEKYMKLLDRLDRIVRPICIPNLTVVIIALQVVVFFAATSDKTLIGRAELNWSAVMAGEVWRLLTFVMIPPARQPIFLLFALYLFHLMGSALEQTWVRFATTYFSIWAIFLLSLLPFSPDDSATGIFLQGSIFLAFATYFPRFELRLFFILPVQVRWLAYLQALGYGITIVAAEWNYKLMTIAALGNYIIFFSPLLWTKAMAKKAKIQWEAKQVKVNPNQPRHTCASCGLNSNQQPDMDFRYCSQCGGNTLTVVSTFAIMNTRCPPESLCDLGWE